MRIIPFIFWSLRFTFSTAEVTAQTAAAAAVTARYDATEDCQSLQQKETVKQQRGQQQQQ